MQTKVFKKHLDILEIATQQTTFAPILANVAMFSPSLVSTDLDCRITVNTGEQLPKLTAGLAQLKKLAANAKADDLVFSSGGNALTVRAGKMETRMPSIDPGEFPKWETVDFLYSYSLPFSVFMDIIGRVNVWADYSGGNVLSGLCLRFAGGAVEFAATNGSRLHVVSLPADLHVDGLEVLIPGHYLDKIRKKMRTMKGMPDVVIRFGIPDVEAEKPDGTKCKKPAGHPQAEIEIREYRFNIRTLEGTYPRYKQLIPDYIKSTHCFTFHKADLMDALKQLLLPFTNPRTDIVRASLGDAQAVFKVDTPDAWESSIPVPCSGTPIPRPACKCPADWDMAWAPHASKCPLDSFTGMLETAFNIRYLIDALGAVDADLVSLHGDGGLKPFILRSADDSLPFTGLIMPVQVKY